MKIKIDHIAKIIFILTPIFAIMLKKYHVFDFFIIQLDPLSFDILNYLPVLFIISAFFIIRKAIENNRHKKLLFFFLLLSIIINFYISKIEFFVGDDLSGIEYKEIPFNVYEKHIRDYDPTPTPATTNYTGIIANVLFYTTILLFSYTKLKTFNKTKK